MTVAEAKPAQLPDVRIVGLPDSVCLVERNILLGRVQKAARDFLNGTGTDELSITVCTTAGSPSGADQSETERHGTSPPLTGNGKGRQDSTHAEESTEAAFSAVAPLYSWDRVILAAELRERIESAVEAIRHTRRLFDEWGLREIEPFPRAALNFFGPPGTGKTLTAHAVADLLGRPIIVASYAQIESKFLGDGPKNAARLFEAAEEAGAVLFIDEADSLLSARLTSASQGSERAANSLTSQLLISLERFSGVVIFATNLLENYDRAFDTRVQHIEFTLPDEASRRDIWRKHLPDRLPLADNVSIEELAQIDDVCGRDVRNAVIMAATRTVRSGSDQITREALLASLHCVRESRKRQTHTADLTNDERQRLQDRLKSQFAEPSTN